MGRTHHSELESQLIDTRSRMRSVAHDGGLQETLFRSRRLTAALDGLGDAADPELYRYFPVAAIAILESLFRITVANAVNAGSPYMERGLGLAKDQLRASVEHFGVLHRKTVTIGEMVAHSLPFNAISSLENSLSALFANDFKSAVSDSEVVAWRGSSTPQRFRIVPDVSALWRGLAETFIRRHILAHEAASEYRVSYDDARTAVASVEMLGRALEAMLWATIWKDEPDTQAEFNKRAWREYRAARSDVANSLRLALAIASADGARARFRRLHLSWKRSSLALAAWSDEHYTTGSIRPMIAAQTHSLAYRNRLAEINDWIGHMRPENPPTP